jgi:hypothetical protein
MCGSGSALCDNFPMTGYSQTPLVKKLGIKEGFIVCPIDAPANYRLLLHPLPPTVKFKFAPSAATDLVHVFATRRAGLARTLSSLRRKLSPSAAIWVSWPKKASKVPTDITEDTIREIALPLGFVDLKVCAVTDVWSGLKIVVRKALRT